MANLGIGLLKQGNLDGYSFCFDYQKKTDPSAQI